MKPTRTVSLEYLDLSEEELARRAREALGYDSDGALTSGDWDDILKEEGLRERVERVAEAVTQNPEELDLREAEISSLKKWLLTVCADALALEHLPLEWKERDSSG